MHSRGFTLVEMLVVMTISAILIAAAVPAFQWTIARNRISDATNQLLSHLEYARMEASRRGNTVSLCRSTNPNAAVAALACSSAATATADGNDWAAGWIVFEKVLPNVDASNFEAGDQVIFRQQAMGGAGNARVMIHSNIRPERSLCVSAAWRRRHRGRRADVRDRLRHRADPDFGDRAITTIALDRCRPLYSRLPRSARCALRAPWPALANDHEQLLQILPRLQAGLSMIEVLVSLTIVAFGVLGLLGLQARALSFQRDSFDRRTAAEMVAQLAERMRANHMGLTGGLYAPPTAVVFSPHRRDARSDPAVCSPGRLHAHGTGASRLGAVEGGIPATQSRCCCLPALGSGRCAFNHDVGRVAGAAANVRCRRPSMY